MSGHPAFDEALEAVRARKGIVWPPPDPQTETDDDDTDDQLPPVPMPNRSIDLDRETVFLRFIVLHDLSRKLNPNLGGRRQRVLKGMLRMRDSHCTYCGRAVKKKSATLDHVIPASRGGPSAPDNLLLACNRCNAHKGNLTVDEWLLCLEHIANRVRQVFQPGQYAAG